MTTTQQATRHPAEIIHQHLIELKHRQGELDAEQAYWLREAVRHKIWLHFNYAHELPYMDQLLGIAPKTAQERLRVARLLSELPQLTESLRSGELPYSSVKELTRVVTPETEAVWLASTRGKTVHEIQQAVSGHKRGDLPTDPVKPELRQYDIHLRVSGETYALWRQAQTLLNDENGTNLDDDGMANGFASAVLDGCEHGEPSGRARHQISLTVCEQCNQGWQHGGGAKIPVGRDVVERAQCDAQHIGSIHAADPARAYQDVPPRVARMVWHRDGGRCRAPGCRSSRGLEIHHIRWQVHGGSHEISNLILLCSSCHTAHHRGHLEITGTAEELHVTRQGSPVGAFRPREAAAAYARAEGIPSDEELGAVYVKASDHPRPELVVAAIGDWLATLPRDDQPSRSDVGALEQDPHRGREAHEREHRAYDGPRGCNTNLENVESPEAVGATSAHGTLHTTDVAATGSHNVEPAEAVGATSAHGTLHTTDVAATGSQRVEVVGATSAHKPGRLESTIMHVQAKEALVGMGWKRPIASAALRDAMAAVGEDATVELLVVEALRRCPKPK